MKARAKPTSRIEFFKFIWRLMCGVMLVINAKINLVDVKTNGFKTEKYVKLSLKVAGETNVVYTKTIA